MNFRNISSRLNSILPLLRALGSRDESEFQLRYRRVLFNSLRPYASQITCERDGILWSVATEDPGISKKLFIKGRYQAEEVDQLIRFLKVRGSISTQRNVVIDVGANIGVPSIPIARLTGLRVIAIEPLPEAFELLLTNVAQNGLIGLITCVQAAVLDRAGFSEMVTKGTVYGESEISLEGGDQGFGKSSLLDRKSSVKVERLSSILAAEGIGPERVAFVWSDTQGCEADIIESGSLCWEAGAPLFAEVWPRGLEKHGGVGRFASLVKKHFSCMIPKNDLLQRGEMADLQPIARIDQLIGLLEMSSSAATDHTDILLIP